jgi:hypothetical protein
LRDAEGESASELEAEDGPNRKAEPKYQSYWQRDQKSDIFLPVEPRKDEEG